MKNRLLQIQNDVNSGRKTVFSPALSLSNYKTLTAVRALQQDKKFPSDSAGFRPYLIIAGKISRQNSGEPVSGLNVKYCGFKEKQEKMALALTPHKFQSKTNAKGEFFLVLTHENKLRDFIQEGEVTICLAGQNDLFTLPVMPLKKAEKVYQQLFPGKSIESLLEKIDPRINGSNVDSGVSNVAVSEIFIP